MCNRCPPPLLKERDHNLPVKYIAECSWCDETFKVCEIAGNMIVRNEMSRLCNKCNKTLHTQATPLYFKGVTYWQWDDFETDGGFQDNAIRHLEGD